jgi:hypothetical protein
MPFVKVIKEPKPGSLRTGEVLEVGKVVEMSEDSANRWVRRGVVTVVEKPADEPKPDSAAGDKSGNAGRGKGTPAG